MTDLPSAQVTVADLYRELVGMRTDVAKVLTKMERVDERNHAADQIHTDHEGRIRASEQLGGQLAAKTDQLVKDGADTEGRLRLLERFRWQVIGALIVIQALGFVLEWALTRRR